MQKKTYFILFSVVVFWGCEVGGRINVGARALDDVKEPPPVEKCQDMPEGQGTCTPDELGATVLEVVSWKLLQEGEEVVPLRDVGVEADNPQAGWLGAGAGHMELVAEGAGGGGGLRVWTENHEAVCTLQKKAEGLERYTWSCVFPAGFAGEGPTVEVQVELGEAVAQKRVYRAEPLPPELTVTTQGNGVLGTTLTLCAKAEDRPGAPANSVSLDNIVLEMDGSFLVLPWTEDEGNTPTHKCLSALLPLELNDLGTLDWSVDVTVTDVAHNKASSKKAGHWVLGRIATHVSTGIGGALMPLAWSNNRLVIGTSNQVYFYNSDNQNFENGAPPHVGTLTGLSVLGDSGRVAISTQASVSVVGMNGQPSSANCPSNQGGAGSNAEFVHGLSLLSVGNADGTGNWRFAAPLNDTRASSNANELLAYIPNASSPNHCRWSSPFHGNVIAPLVGLDEPLELMVIRQEPDGVSPVLVRQRKYDAATSTWENEVTAGGIQVDLLQIFGAAANRVSDSATAWHFWVTAQWENIATDASGFDLMRGRTDQGTAVLSPEATTSIGALALDFKGRAYAVVKLVTGDYELHSHPDYATVDTTSSDDRKVALPPTSAAPVGSPILGQPPSGLEADAEVYVLMTDGTLHAFTMEDLTPLWTQPLLSTTGQPISIAPTAQPVLKGNKLWLMSTEGELYAVVVNSDGLHKTAHWPRMLRDNCNSSSHVSTPGNLPSCF